MALVCLVNAALSVLVVAVVSPVALVALAPMSWCVTVAHPSCAPTSTVPYAVRSTLAFALQIPAQWLGKSLGRSMSIPLFLAYLSVLTPVFPP
jgi:hypothetical protein